MKPLRPPEIVSVLDHYLVGQQKAKRAVAVAIRNRWRSQQSALVQGDDHGPYRYLIAGPRGVGKSQTVQIAARAVEAPFVRVSALQLAAAESAASAAEAVLEGLVESVLDRSPTAEPDSAVEEAAQAGIILIDGLDRWIPASDDASDARLETAQRSLYRLAGMTRLDTRYGPVATHDILMFATGNLTTGRIADLPDDLQMLFTRRIHLEALSDVDLFSILANRDASPVNDYVALLATEGLQLGFTTCGLEAIAAEASERNRKVEDIGARRLAEVIETVLDDLLYDDAGAARPDVTIDAAYVESRLDGQKDEEDLDDFIL